MALTDEERFRIHEQERARLAAIAAAEKAAKKKLTPGRVAKWVVSVLLAIPMLGMVLASLMRY